jgi:hypothetical protein
MSVYEHVEALSRDCSGWTGAHAITGVEKRPLDWDKHVIRDDRYSLPVTQSQFDAFHDALESQIGVKYNYWLIVGIALHWRWLALLSKGREDCSQLIIWCLQKAGINPLNTLASYDAPQNRSISRRCSLGDALRLQVLSEQENDQDDQQDSAQSESAVVSRTRTKVETATAEQEDQDDK